MNPNPDLAARAVIQRIVDAATRNPHTGVYIGCEHFRMKEAVENAEQWLHDNPVNLVPGALHPNSPENRIREDAQGIGPLY